MTEDTLFGFKALAAQRCGHL